MYLLIMSQLSFKSDNNILNMFFQIAAKLGVSNSSVKNCVIWGNHSSTQYPDVNQAVVDLNGKSMPVREAVKDDNWLNNDFIKVCYHQIWKQVHDFYIPHEDLVCQISLKSEIPMVSQLIN